jgi:succinoglycan biosynthesis protein ExoV
VIAKIAAARLVLTESLHGAILADTYGIPWSVFATSGNFGSTKFLDWCLSLDIDFSFTYVPPPDAGHILEHGKGPCIWGHSVTPSVDDAVAAFQARIAPPVAPGWRGRVKAKVNEYDILKRMLPYAPGRTAAALTRLAEGPVMLSRETVRQRLQERMLARLMDLAAHRSPPTMAGVREHPIAAPRVPAGQ